MKNTNVTFKGALLALLTTVLKPLKISYIIGSYAAFFSITHCYAPLIGKYNGTLTGLMFCTALTLFKGLYSGFGLTLLVYHIPTFFGILYTSWMLSSSKTKDVRIVYKACLTGFALICMMLFIAHPIGYDAAPYALLWIIPAATPWLSRNSFFIQALGTTFLCHAVGSVIWIYSVPMTAALWLGLIPVALVERCTFALGMVICIKAIDFAKTKISIKSTRWISIHN